MTYINGDNEIEIADAWIHIIKAHNTRLVTMRTYKGTASQSRNSNNGDRNAPIAANQRAPI